MVMAHGLSATKELRLPAYAERFCAAGIGVLLFDYRHFGASGGEPRQLLDISRQHADFRRALAYARDLDWVDPERVGLFGSSFAGGHVLAVGAADGRVAAIVSQCPFTDPQSRLARCSSMNPERSKSMPLTTNTQIGNASVNHMLRSLAISNATATR